MAQPNQTDAAALPEELQRVADQLPEELRPWVHEYGPALLAMGADGIKAWIDRLVAGDIEAAYRQVLEGMGNQELLSEWAKINASWRAENARNAARVGLQRSALAGLLKILLAIALAMVGL